MSCNYNSILELPCSIAGTNTDLGGPNTAEANSLPHEHVNSHSRLVSPLMCLGNAATDMAVPINLSNTETSVPSPSAQDYKVYKREIM
ncbi:HNF4A [Bugula neritina]|uniref:HNF4A n=1 Tax=Bugula neritina TaxID=10212 RepID=A0A7J7KFY5_BUGNE|nr:HNF4A [Bugula neritina]